MEKIIKKYVIIISFDQLKMKCSIKKYSILHYQHLMINIVIKVILKVYFGVEIWILDNSYPILPFAISI